MNFTLHPQRVLLVFECLGQAGVNLRSLWRLVEDIAEGIDALHETGTHLLSGPLLPKPHGTDGKSTIERETGEWTRSGRGNETGQRVDDRLQGWP